MEHGKLKMMPLSGVEEIGMNMTIYSYEKGNEKFTILVDCGVTFDDLPGSNVMMSDLKTLIAEGLRIDSIILTHGHEDHIGAIPYLFDYIDSQMYATPFTAKLIEKKMKRERKKDYKIDVVQLGESRNIGPFHIQWIGVTHSIPDSAMLAIEAGGVRVLHTGDWRFDNDPFVGKVTDYKKIEAFGKKGVHALIADSTNIHQEHVQASEGEVAQSLKELILKTKTGRFVLTCFSSNMARIKACIEAARVAKRKVLLLGSSLQNATEIAISLGYLNDDVIISEEEAANLAPEEILIVSTGSQAEPNSSLWKIANKMRSAGSILEKGDTLVFSARVIDGRQNAVRKIINQLVERGVRVLHPWNTKDSCIHASGHPTRPDIEKLWEMVKPNVIIPVHCEAEHRISHLAFAQSKGYKTFNMKNGLMIEITKDEIIKLETYKHGRLAYDGNRLISTQSEVFKQREVMNENGVVIISVGVKNKKPICSVSSFGLYDKEVDVNSKKNIVLSKQLKLDVERILKSFAVTDFTHNNNTVYKKVSEIVRKTVDSQLRKKPLISFHMVI